MSVEITRCEVCGNNELVSVLDLGLHPMCDDLIPFNDERVCKEYPIEILFCKQCITAHQRYQVPKHDLFPSTYHYRSRFTKDVLNGMQILVSKCVQKFGDLQGKKVLDIGCNDGSLLDYFKKQGAITFGVEPTDAYLDAENNGHIIINDYLTIEFAKKFVEKYGKVDFITFTNVFAHIEDLNGVIESLNELMDDDTVIVIENHYLGAVLEKNQFDTFYHEHPRTYSFTSFTYIAQTLGTSILSVEFPSRYGGNIMVFLGNIPIRTDSDETNKEDVLQREKQYFNDFNQLRGNISSWKKRKKELLNQYLQKCGKIKAKAFPGRAAILIKLLEVDESKITAVYEKPGSMKIGHYVPGTRIPICSDDDLFAEKDLSGPLLNLAWHISNEIHSYLENNGYTGEIIDILELEDFK